ncbi:MAG TPA: alpha/beta hydrolase [Permianibacter sp.]|nr:alpha/beta hydrolase [Permianibacter sp.]
MREWKAIQYGLLGWLLMTSVAMSTQARASALDEDDVAPVAAFALPPGVTVQREIAYGADPRQRLDRYQPAAARAAPLMVLVHGGGWARGDKASRAVVANKVRRWTAKGFVVVSVNYRLLPEASPLTQADDVATAVAFVQRHAEQWGADPTAVVLVGHSAGAHLVALLSASATIATRAGVAPWLATVALDSAAFDVEAIMDKRHFRLYDKAFGSERALWRAASPFHVLTPIAPPLLAVCSTRRDVACEQAEAFAGKARSLGVNVTVLPQDLSHRDINEQLGLSSAYTHAVEAFLRDVDARLAVHLAE